PSLPGHHNPYAAAAAARRAGGRSSRDWHRRPIIALRGRRILGTTPRADGKVGGGSRRNLSRLPPPVPTGPTDSLRPRGVFRACRTPWQTPRVCAVIEGRRSQWSVQERRTALGFRMGVCSGHGVVCGAGHPPVPVAPPPVPAGVERRPGHGGGRLGRLRPVRDGRGPARALPPVLHPRRPL